MADALSIDLAKRWKQQRWNPLASITPQSAGQALDQFDSGRLAPAALMWEGIEERDDTAVTVIGKRRSKVSACKWEIIIGDEVGDNQTAEAERHQDALRAFYASLSVRSAVDLDVDGGVKLMVERLMDARMQKYSAFEIAWTGRRSGLTAELWHVPLYFFENMSGGLRFCGVNQGAGVELVRKNWLIGVGRCLMKALTVAYIFKRLSLADWLNLSEKFGIPGVHYETAAKRGTSEWTAALAAAEQVANDFIIVTTAGEKVNLLEVSMAGGDPFAPMVDRMDRAMARIILGADLSTLSRDNGAGASLQGAETDDLVKGDCEWVSETLQRRLDRAVIAWHFGQGVEPLAYFQLSPPADQDTKLEMLVDEHVKKFGVNLSTENLAERYGRTHESAPEDAAKAIKPPAEEEAAAAASTPEPEATPTIPDAKEEPTN